MKETDQTRRLDRRSKPDLNNQQTGLEIVVYSKIRLLGL